MIVSWRQMIGALNIAAGHVCRSPQPAAPAANTALPRFSPNALLICALHASKCTAMHCIPFVLCYSEGGMYSVPRWVPH